MFFFGLKTVLFSDFGVISEYTNHMGPFYWLLVVEVEMRDAEDIVEEEGKSSRPHVGSDANFVRQMFAAYKIFVVGMFV